MNGRIARLIHKYAATFAHVQPGSGRTMERIAKRQWNGADRKAKRSIEVMMEDRVRRFGR